MKQPIKSISLLLLSGLIVFSVGCQKEKVSQENTAKPTQKVYKTIGDAQLVLAAEPTNMQRNNGPENDISSRPVFPYANTKCKVVFLVRGFDPSLPHGGSPNPCSHSSIQFVGYSQPNGQGTVLFDSSLPITGDWQVLTIPSGAYIQFRILSDWFGESSGPCRFKFITGDYGWNKGGVFTWGNIPYNQWLPVITGRFAPKDPSVDGQPTLYDEYLCEPWCTWTRPIYFEPQGEPQPGDFFGVQHLCYYDQEILNPYFYDPRLIATQETWTPQDQVLYIYPIDATPQSHYITKAVHLSSNNEYYMWYNVLGTNGLGIGSFSFGLAPYGARTTGPDCNIKH